MYIVSIFLFMTEFSIYDRLIRLPKINMAHALFSEYNILIVHNQTLGRKEFSAEFKTDVSSCFLNPQTFTF